MTSRETAPHDNQPLVVMLACLRTVLAGFLLLALVRAAVAADAFVVKDIRLEGLQRITAGTVFNYLPVKVGDTVDGTRTAGALRALFGTGFFRDVRLERDGGTLVVSVVERPSIGSIEFTGNEELETEDLVSALEQMGFAQGRVFNRSTFDQVKQELHRTYFAAGKYGARVTGTVTPLERNRVAVKFDISEGVVARIRQINIVGNTAFDDDELLDDFELDTTGFFSFLTRSDRYSKPKLAADLETLRSFYLDNGFINFSIDSTQVTITPDKEDVYVTINITEGGRYVVRDVFLQGALIVPEEELFDRVTVVQDGEFSRKDVTETARRIGERLGVDGYPFANVNAVPEIDDTEKKVDLTFFIDPGQRVYVRRINFKGNAKTRDEVLRREMRQMESGWMSTAAVERSRVRLNRLGYFESVNVDTSPGTGRLRSGRRRFHGGGEAFRKPVARCRILQFAGGGVRHQPHGREFSRKGQPPQCLVQHYQGQPGHLGLLAQSVLDRGRRQPRHRRLQSAHGCRGRKPRRLRSGPDRRRDDVRSPHVRIHAHQRRLQRGAHRSSSPAIRRRTRSWHFEAEHDGGFITLLATAAWANDTRNSRFLPTRGSLTRLSGEVAVPGSELTYYKLFARYQRLFPLAKRFRASPGGRGRLRRRIWRDRRAAPHRELLRRRAPVGAWVQGEYARSAGQQG